MNIYIGTYRISINRGGKRQHWQDPLIL